MPDTPLITSAIKYARESSEPCLFNHVMRSWLFAVSLAQLNQTAHDGEVLAVATLLHAIGWRKRLMGRCDLKWKGRMPHGSLVRSAGLDDRRCQLIWDGVAHTGSVCARIAR
ncbi:MAG: hypothetical protein AUI36_15310 [Cyanobacteria bacterium 13_1_40CM_2_61_4]|nr:MAG: hypothetical protein AUI36_15310 [Cyanobacteria bacterium 13_1_40CM_2_61_4]